jgi:hypothetical protein
LVAQRALMRTGGGGPSHDSGGEDVSCMSNQPEEFAWTSI